MRRAFRHFVFVVTMLMGAASAMPAEPGFVEGHISIGPITPVEHQGDPAPVPREMYAAWELTVFKEDGKTEMAKVAADQQGNYRVALPPGKYVLDFPHRGLGGAAGFPRTVTVMSGRSVRVDADIDTGIR